MNAAALIILIGAAALAAAIGFGAAWGANRYGRQYISRHLPPLWFALGGAALGLAIAAITITDWSGIFGGGDPVAVENVLPYMQVIREREPTLYERIETSIIRDLQDGKGNDQAKTNAKALVNSYVADKIGSLPDDLTYEIYATTRDSLSYMSAQKSYEPCADLALGHNTIDVDPYLSAQLVERNNNNTARVVSTPVNTQAPKMAAEMFQETASRAFAEASQATGIPPEEVERLLGGNGDAAKTCRLMKSFFDALLAQPVDIAAAALRTLSSGERGAAGAVN